MIYNDEKHRRRLRRPPHWVCVSVNFLTILYHRYLWISLIYSLYIPYIFPSYVKYVFPKGFPPCSDCWSNFARFGSKADFLRKIPDDSAWFCLEKLKNHGFEIKQFKKLQKSQTYFKKLHLIQKLNYPSVTLTRKPQGNLGIVGIFLDIFCIFWILG